MAHGTSNPYARIFKAPGAKWFCSAAFVARFPVAMAPIGIVSMLSQTHGQYWLAGAVSAAFTMTNALLSPQVSRLVDRFGQTAVAGPTTLISVLAFLALILAADLHWPLWTLFSLALPAAAMPSIPALVRARWSELFRDRAELQTAFAFESAADELVYMAGASLSVGLCAAVSPEAGLAASTALLALGSLAFLLQRASEPKLRPADIGLVQISAIRFREVQVVTIGLAFVGIMFATTEVSVVAIAAQRGQPGAASLILGLYAAGSFMVGLVLGIFNPAMAPQRRLLAAVSMLALTALAPLLAINSVTLLAIAVFCSGMAIAPTLASAFRLIEQRVPASRLTEGVTWVMTGIDIGMAAGFFASSWVVDGFGAHNGFWVSVAAGFAGVIVFVCAQQTLSINARKKHSAIQGGGRPCRC